MVGAGLKKPFVVRSIRANTNIASYSAHQFKATLEIKGFYILKAESSFSVTE